MDKQLRAVLRPIMRHKREMYWQTLKTHRNRAWMGWVGALAVSLILWAWLFIGIAGAEVIPDEVAVKCIIGEAGNQGEQGMYALASGLLNRGTVKGVYGCNASHVSKEPEWVYKQAREALQRAKVKRLHNADHWENISAFGKPKWAFKMKEVYRYKDHVFYARNNLK